MPISEADTVSWNAVMTAQSAGRAVYLEGRCLLKEALAGSQRNAVYADAAALSCQADILDYLHPRAGVHGQSGGIVLDPWQLKVYMDFLEKFSTFVMITSTKSSSFAV
ncbi:MAG: hypothetical protein V8S89_04955 [Oscillospiraceae bacterium]